MHASVRKQIALRFLQPLASPLIITGLYIIGERWNFKLLNTENQKWNLKKLQLRAGFAALADRRTMNSGNAERSLCNSRDSEH